MDEKTPNIKLFFGDASGNTADQLFGEWIEEHPTVEIIDFQYHQNRYGIRSITVFYKGEEYE